MGSVMLVAMLIANWFTIPSSVVKRAESTRLDVVCAVGGCPIGMPECAVDMSAGMGGNVHFSQFLITSLYLDASVGELLLKLTLINELLIFFDDLSTKTIPFGPKTYDHSLNYHARSGGHRS
ncbi:hypothetical protein CRG98_013911 [Punica granatum]|uniref:Uncharacterized protein n=1 Tax=Punica granatum TaxID=22663 RepID=A0A2I0KD51_PUNGR|nr:hypothetical protein CRG98_013911 [Punica granatum]